MNSNYNSVAKNFDKKMTSQQRSLTPAVLGIPSVSHGAKLPPNMNSQDKTELLMKLEAWRQARRDKLIATVLAKGKQSVNSKVPANLPKSKVKATVNSASGTESNQSNCDGRKTVFERLYENAGKQTMVKPSEENKDEKSSNIKKTHNFKPFLCQNKVKQSKVPNVILTVETNKAVTNTNSSSQKVKLPDSVVEDEGKLGLKDPQCIESRFQETELVKENKILEEQAPLVDITSNGTQNLNTEEAGNIVSEGENILKEERGTNEKYYEQFKSAQCCEPEKNSNLKEEKLFKNGQVNSTKGLQKVPLRRSISLIFRKKTGNYESAIHRTQSECNLEEIIKNQEKEIPEKNVETYPSSNRSNKNETAGHSIKGTKTVCFVTPKPNSLSAFHLRNKLESWLVENGHSIDTYRHLRCFGLSAEEAVYTPHHRQQKVDDSDNASFYSTAPNTPIAGIIDESDKENVTPSPSVPKVEKVDPRVVEGWLSDLHRLIVHVKYPGDRCEEWLNSISKKFPNCTQLPIYWECFAAINGNPTAGAIVEENEEDRSSENDEVEGSLAELLDKLVIDEKCKSVSKTERGLSMKNIFKSKTVKFALKEKAIKQVDPALGKETRQKVLVATPVRRSARIQTPDKSNIVMSLRSIDPELRRGLSFKPNEALFTG